MDALQSFTAVVSPCWVRDSFESGYVVNERNLFRKENGGRCLLSTVLGDINHGVKR